MRQLIAKMSDRAEFVVVSALCFSYAAFTSLGIFLSGSRTYDLGTGPVLRAILAKILILAVVIAILRLRGWQPDRLGLNFSWKAAAAGIPMFVMYLLVFWITATFVLLIWPDARTVWVFRYTFSAPMWLMLVFIIVNAVLEEFAVTAYVIASLSHKGAALAIAASTLLRLAYHLYEGPLTFAGIVPLGVLFGALFWRWRNIWPLIVAHSIANIVAYAVAPR